ncbi:hypothetical protein BT63DRAFT_100631 [Microthyrium microscopicum]|uniref:Uncharacterized protein n=1 Tax=Microthyrium microscopicum TaxID=703497 RepID=A0A6A6TZI6_9PEZI|nr:hypothetical protein BT63DRAFT_100631 [Microthyrium microscopicum]
MSTARRDSTFLVLAPESSSGFPKEDSRSSSMSSTASKPILDNVAVDGSAIDTTAPADLVVPVKDRRSSSVSSNGSARRFLKLGPVHFGGDPKESDWVEVPDEK